MKIIKFEPGDRVRMANPALHRDDPQYYPEAGTVGVVTNTPARPDGYCMVQWPKGSTSVDDLWAVSLRDIEPAEEDVGSLQRMHFVPVLLTDEQYARIMELACLMELDPEKEFITLAQRVVCDSLDRRIEAAICAQERRGLRG